MALRTSRALRVAMYAPLFGSVACLPFLLRPAMAADEIGEIHVIASRIAPSVNEPVYATTVVTQEDLAQSGENRLDDVLRSVPGFGLFRRQSSRASHPTTQGVTLRGLGPSGAGRTLVLLDGVPQNDPFGGWIDWSRLPSASIDTVQITRGGGAGPWGNSALAGTIRLYSRTESGSNGWAELKGDSVASIDGTTGGQLQMGDAQVFGTLHGHSSDGVYLIRKDQRGPADVPTADEGGWGQAGVRFSLAGDVDVTATGSYSKDRYVNGVAIAISRTRNADGSLSLVHNGGPDEVSWETHAYVRDEAASSVFSSVNATRTAATPSLNQFSVPATAAGGNAVVRVPVAANATIETGADLRFVDGATNEQFTYVNGAFTRLRHAGGSQVVTGAFAELNWLPVPSVTVTAGGRVDHWEQNDGVRNETIIATGAPALAAVYPNRDGNVGNFRVGLRDEVSSNFVLRAVGYSGFRMPTLNELYRPFRVGNDITEANPYLQNERLYGVEGGAEWSAAPGLTVNGTVFRNWLSNAVGNITITTTPGLNTALNVVVPAGGVLRQRQNVDRIIATGFEGGVEWQATSQIELSLNYLLTSPKITRASAQPNLVGLKLAQVAKHTVVAGATFHADQDWTLRAEFRYASSQFDDDQNTRLLKSYAVGDLYIDRAITSYASVFLGVENFLNADIQAGRSADGLVTVGAPRMVSGGVRARF